MACFSFMLLHHAVKKACGWASATRSEYHIYVTYGEKDVKKLPLSSYILMKPIFCYVIHWFHFHRYSQDIEGDAGLGRVCLLCSFSFFLYLLVGHRGRCGCGSRSSRSLSHSSFHRRVARSPKPHVASPQCRRGRSAHVVGSEIQFNSRSNGFFKRILSLSC